MKRKRLRLLDRTHDENLGPFVARFGVRGTRIKQRIGMESVILLRYQDPVPHVPITTPLLQMIFGDPTLYSGPVFIPEECDAWNRPWQHTVPVFNCHAYSLGERIGLTPEDWVEGEPTDLSMDTNPTAILMSAYFRQIRTLAANQTAILVKDERLREGDIISFTRERRFWGTVHEHSGRIVRHAGENWLASKFQAGRLLITPITEALGLYPNTQMLRVYRFLGNV